MGNLELCEYDLCGPIRSGTPINFSWSNFRQSVGDDLKIHGRVSLHYDRRIIDSETAQAILQALVKEVEDVAQFGGSSG